MGQNIIIIIIFTGFFALLETKLPQRSDGIFSLGFYLSVAIWLIVGYI